MGPHHKPRHGEEGRGRAVRPSMGLKIDRYRERQHAAWPAMIDLHVPSIEAYHGPKNRARDTA